MSTLTNKQIRLLMKELSPNPGYVLKLTRAQFEELVEDTIDIDISEQSESNGKRFKQLLKSCTDEQVIKLIDALRVL